MVATKNKYPMEFGIPRSEPPLERWVRRGLLALIKPIAPNYVRKSNECHEAPKLRLDEKGLYGLAIWQLPHHEIQWHRMKSFRYEDNRVFELTFEPKNMKSNDRRDKISKARVSVADKKEVEDFIIAMLNESVMRERK